MPPKKHKSLRSLTSTQETVNLKKAKKINLIPQNFNGHILKAQNHTLNIGNMMKKICNSNSNTKIDPKAKKNTKEAHTKTTLSKKKWPQWKCFLKTTFLWLKSAEDSEFPGKISRDGHSMECKEKKDQGGKGSIQRQKEELPESWKIFTEKVLKLSTKRYRASPEP
jgi:hypothetical protein